MAIKLQQFLAQEIRLDSISFAYENNKYHFMIFFNNNERILVKHDGTLAVMKLAE